MAKKFKVKLTKEQKWAQANEEFVNTVVGLSVSDLNVKLSSLSKDLEEVHESVEKLMEPGKAMYEAKQAYDNLKGPFNDSKKLLKQKTKYVYRLLKDKGGK